MKRITTVFTLALAVVLFSLPAYAGMASIPYTYGYGARGVAMGSAYSSLAGEAANGFYNPATLALLENSQFQLGYLYAAPEFEGGPSGNTYTFDSPNKVVQANLAFKMSGLLKSKRPIFFALHIALDDNAAAFIRFYDWPNEEGYYIRYGSTSFNLSATMGFGITDWLFLGAGVLTTLHGTSDFILNTDLSANTHHEGLAMDADVVLAPIASVFLRFKPVDVGVTFHGKIAGQFNPIIVDTQAEIGSSPLASLPMELRFKDSFYPHRVGLGCTWRATESFTIAADAVWYKWSEFQDYISFQDLTRRGVEIEFQDIYVPHLGLEYEPFELFFLRAGYGYEDTPVVTGGNSDNMILDSPKHMVSAGVGYTWQSPPLLSYPISFDGAYFMHSLVDTTLTADDGAEYESSGMLNGGAGTITIRF